MTVTVIITSPIVIPGEVRSYKVRLVNIASTAIYWCVCYDFNGKGPYVFSIWGLSICIADPINIMATNAVFCSLEAITLPGKDFTCNAGVFNSMHFKSHRHTYRLLAGPAGKKIIGISELWIGIRSFSFPSHSVTVCAAVHFHS